MNNPDRDQEGSTTERRSRTDIPDTPSMNVKVQETMSRGCIWSCREVIRFLIGVYSEIEMLNAQRWSRPMLQV